jgi:hypothetical protein
LHRPYFALANVSLRPCLFQKDRPDTPIVAKPTTNVQVLQSKADNNTGLKLRQSSQKEGIVSLIWSMEVATSSTSSPSSTYGRACTSCARAKAKCIPNQNTGAKCERYQLSTTAYSMSLARDLRIIDAIVWARNANPQQHFVNAGLSIEPELPRLGQPSSSKSLTD